MTSGHLQETHRQSVTLPENLPDRRGTRRRLIDSLHGVRDVWTAAGDSQAVPGVSETVRAPSGESQTVCDGAKTDRRRAGYLKMVCYGANTVSSPAGVPQAGLAHARDPNTLYYVQRPSGQLQETPRQSVTVPDSLSIRRRLIGNLMQVP
ncbi:hypothetical protein DPMN_125607 [Dreissena polymorpha]|uniref:Uncharacterized protein n=1 Tax=Dreissena polymorpha TaxID=45954 RepID=A0A9D4GY41_DREPO|nr:hypothetical protein DPMN_125607 [Dreissena polymorpha]